MNKNKKVLIIAAAVLLVIAAVLLIVDRNRQPQTAQGAKTISVTVIMDGETTRELTIRTDAEFLRGALEQENLIEGTESEYGLYVTTVDGVAANDAKRQWWCFTKDGEMLNTGVDDTMIADGEHYEAFIDVY